MAVLDELTKQTDTLTNPYIERWKENGGKVIGYYCTYIPEEIIHAAGILPYRMRATGSTSSELGDMYASSTTCSFCRHSLDQAMRGEYAFLDGAVALHGCDHIARMFDAWRYGKVPLANSFYLHFLDVPFKVDALAVDWMALQLGKFKRSLEDHFGVTINDEALRQSIKTYNEKHHFLKSLYEMRKKKAPPITGAEALGICIASTSMPVEEFNQLLKQLLDELRERDGLSNHKARLLIAGGELEAPGYIEVIEELGGLVVTDLLCFGLRGFWDLVDEDAEPIAALARRYIQRSISCPRMIDYRKRLDFTKNLVQEFNVDGIIMARMKYCDNWACDGAMIKYQAQKENTPYLLLEREHLMSAVGQMRTRVQAFLETIGR